MSGHPESGQASAQSRERGGCESVVTSRVSDHEPNSSTAEQVTDPAQAEIAALAAEQRKDDTFEVERARFGGARTAWLDTDNERGAWMATNETDPAFIYERDHEPSHEEARADVLRARQIIDDEVTNDMREAYDLIYVRRLTYRQAEEVSGISRSTLSDRIAALHKIVARGLLSDAGT